MSPTVQARATFHLASYRQSIAEMFSHLDRAAQRELIDRLALLPRHIHRMAQEGLIADSQPRPG